MQVAYGLGTKLKKYVWMFALTQPPSPPVCIRAHFNSPCLYQQQDKAKITKKYIDN